MENLPSILQSGVLSHTRATNLEHASMADPVVQQIRAGVVVAGGRRLHQYANLYINARNPMMYALSMGPNSTQLCVLRISPDVLDLPGVVVTDQNAASGHARFSPPSAGLPLLDRDYVFARYWTHPEDQIAEWRHKAAMCAEVLVPDVVPAQHILGIYVPTQDGAQAVASVAPDIPIEVKSDLFFR
ncbi:MAG TPA: DUF4433 domain-containing protein [Chloroflexota bacterium]|nr:DUF4433 domain-containing protein [Chloroflexota bacterium]